MSQIDEFVLEGRSTTDGKGLSVRIAEGKIIEAAEADVPVTAPYISRGFFDIQVNGYSGIDYSAPNLSRENVRKLIEMLARSGTTRHLPTIVTSPRERMTRNLRVLADAVASSKEIAGAIPGIHLEGPYISSEEGPRGAHDAAFIRDPSIEEFDEWQDAADGMIRMITLAPERKGALEFIQTLAERNVVVGIGHTAASPDLVHEAVAAGAQFSTHLGNGCSAMIPRLRNHLWEQLAEDRLRAGLIVDGFHLPEAAVKVFWKAKGPDRVVLVSDVAMMGGREPGIYRWGNISAQVFHDGHVGLAGTEYLAGAGHLLDRCIAQFVNFTRADLTTALRLCTTNPSILFGIEPHIDPFRTGSTADLAVFRWKEGAQSLDVIRTLLGGEELFAASRAS